jgi:hypothetical protein
MSFQRFMEHHLGVEILLPRWGLKRYQQGASRYLGCYPPITLEKNKNDSFKST